LGGQKHPIVIDDSFPVDNRGHPVNARPSDAKSGWWMPLLEKAYAKLSVNYENLDGGDGTDNMVALRTLTGLPVDRIPANDADLAKKVSAYLKKGYAMNVYLEKNKKSALGLRPERSYNVLGIRNVASTSSMVLLRDPWTEDFDSHYSRSLRHDTAGRVLQIPLQAFTESFEAVNIAMLDDKWNITT